MSRSIEFQTGVIVVVTNGQRHHCYFVNGLKSSTAAKGERLLELSRLIQEHSHFGRVAIDQLELTVWTSSGWEPSVRSWIAEKGYRLTSIELSDEGEMTLLKYDSLTGSLKSDRTQSSRLSDPSDVSSASHPLKPSHLAKPSPRPNRARVLIVDDSKAMRLALRKALTADSRIEVIGEAANGPDAIKLIPTLKPDAMTLDIQMPGMSGVELLKELHKSYQKPPPAVMVSALGMNEGREVLNALEAGAFDYFQKPDASELLSQGAVLAEKLLTAVEAWQKEQRKRDIGNEGQIRGSISALSKGTARISTPFSNIDLLCIGASTGGTEAIRRLFDSFPEHVPPTVIVQHIPPVFSKAFADRLNSLNPFEVREAVDGDILRSDLVLVAPGGIHVEVHREGPHFVVRYSDAAPVNRFKPSVDVLFQSAARLAGRFQLTGLILTGMGSDGAKGLLAMQQAGARTIGQDEESCVVYGMPRAAFELGAVQEVYPLENIAGALSKRQPNKRRPHSVENKSAS